MGTREGTGEAIVFIFEDREHGKIRYFPPRAFLSHTRFHYRQCLSIILNGRDHVLQHVATKIRNSENTPEKTIRERRFLSQASSPVNFYWHRRAGLFATR